VINQGTPMATSYNSYSYIAAAAAAASAQQAQQQQPVVGSLEALRANAVWNMPHGPAFQNGQPNAAYLGTSHARCAAEVAGSITNLRGPPDPQVLSDDATFAEVTNQEGELCLRLTLSASSHSMTQLAQVTLQSESMCRNSE
jgi:hypothetical protein